MEEWRQETIHGRDSDEDLKWYFNLDFSIKFELERLPRGYFNLCEDIIQIYEVSNEEDLEMAIEENSIENNILRNPTENHAFGNDPLSAFDDSEEMRKENGPEEMRPIQLINSDDIGEGGDDSMKNKKKEKEDNIADVETCASSEIDPNECNNLFFLIFRPCRWRFYKISRRIWGN